MVIYFLKISDQILEEFYKNSVVIWFLRISKSSELLDTIADNQISDQDPWKIS